MILYIIVISMVHESGKREGREGNFVLFYSCTHITSEDSLQFCTKNAFERLLLISCQLEPGILSSILHFRGTLITLAQGASSADFVRL